MRRRWNCRDEFERDVFAFNIDLVNPSWRGENGCVFAETVFVTEGKPERLTVSQQTPDHHGLRLRRVDFRGSWVTRDEGLRAALLPLMPHSSALINRDLV